MFIELTGYHRSTALLVNAEQITRIRKIPAVKKGLFRRAQPEHSMVILGTDFFEARETLSEISNMVST